MSLPFTLQFHHHWHSPPRLLEQHHERVPERLEAALLYTGSLTGYLERLWQQPVVVHLQRQYIQATLDDDERLWSGYPPLDCAVGVLSRVAWLQVAGQERLVAASQLSLAGLPESLRGEIENGQRPLGALFLEQAAEVARDHLQLALARAPELAQRLGEPSEQLFWCRRSLFRAGEARARIIEVFLTGF
ncbi:MAG: chorismate lyase [Magnetococcales bacterium]|nr:chorismate lyase [Magnetococcales bacterium]